MGKCRNCGAAIYLDRSDVIITFNGAPTWYHERGRLGEYPGGTLYCEPRSRAEPMDTSRLGGAVARTAVRAMVRMKQSGAFGKKYGTA